MVFGTIGLRGAYRNAKRYLVPPKDALHWMRMHIGNMLGSYIGAITAFLVNQSEHIPIPGVFLWLGPTAIIVPIIVMELRKYKPKKLT
jgi:hypothetical protein